MEFPIASIPDGISLTNNLIDRIRKAWLQNGRNKLTEDEVRVILADMGNGLFRRHPAIPSLNDVKMPNILDELHNQFAEGACMATEKLAKELLEAGYDSNTVAIGQRVWFDENENRMQFECFPIKRK